jgi:hypothetical protein
MNPYSGDTPLVLAKVRHDEFVAEADEFRLLRQLRDPAGPPRRNVLVRWRRPLPPSLN